MNEPTTYPYGYGAPLAEALALRRAGDASVDTVAWSEIVRTVHGQMRGLVGPGHRDVEDLTQVALEKVHRALPRFEGRSELTTFTYRICAHVAMDHWRGWRRWARRFQFWTDDASERREAEGSVAPLDLSAASLELERARRLHEHLAKLSAEKRVVIALCYFEDLPASEAAAILEIPEPTVRSRLRVAKAELLERLSGDPMFEDDRVRERARDGAQP